MNSEREGAGAPDAASLRDPEAARRIRRALALIALGALGLAFLLASAHAVKVVLLTRAVVREAAARGSDEAGKEFVERLGGPEAAVGRLAFYLRLPRRALPRGWRDDRWRMAWFLGACGEPAVPILARLLRDADPEVRWRAAWSLGRIGSEAKVAVPALAKALGDAEGFVRVYAAEVLARIGSEATEAVPALVAALGDADGSVRMYAARALGEIGPEARAAIPELERLAAGDPSDNVRAAAAEALSKIKGASPPGADETRKGPGAP